jgi:S1-C subfamily serine protease
MHTGHVIAAVCLLATVAQFLDPIVNALSEMRRRKRHPVFAAGAPSVFLLLLLTPFSVRAAQVAGKKITTGGQVVEESVPAIAQAASKAVVLVVASDASGNRIIQGSGIIVSSDGSVATNFHVIKGCSSAIVKFTDGAFYKVAGVLAADPTRDIAILKIESSAKSFDFLSLADSDQAQVGEHVVAVGSPLAVLELTGQSNISTEATVSDGIISGKRDWEGHGIEVFQTTAPISHGSSGGALLNLQGQILGITTLTIEEGQNLNFVIPAKYLKLLLSSEMPLTPLGETESSKSDQVQHRNGLDQFVGTYTGIWQSHYGSGVAVLSVTSDSGGLKARVVITGSSVGYKGDSLTVEIKDMGEGVLTVDLKAQNSPLTASGIFRNGSFIGDFRFRYHLAVDRGQWRLQR